jgi:single-strand DNA-binding protein
LDSWDDKETGQKRHKLKVVALRVQFLGAPKGASGGGEVSDQPPAAKPARPRPEPAPAAEEQGPSGEGEDNIPL